MLNATTMTGYLAISFCIICIFGASFSSAVRVCEEHEVIEIHRDACHLRVTKRNIRPTMLLDSERQSVTPDHAHVYPGIDLASYLQRLMQFRGKRAIMTPDQLTAMRDRCCVHGCTPRDFIRFACEPN